MWKYVSRRIRDTFERSVNHFDKRSTSGVVNASGNVSDDKGKRSAPPCRWFCARRCWGSFREDNNTNSDRWNFDQLNRSWIGALSWSSALVVGWYTSQLIHLKIKYHSKKPKTCLAKSALLSCIYPYIDSVHKNPAYLNSISQIEKAIASFTPTVHLISNETQEEINEHTTFYGSRSANPDTSDDDLGDVLNSIENRLGLSAIENGHHQDGLNLLRSAATRNHAPAIYNLGLCYELGLGVKANEKTAMELYRSAAALQHPGALYNLGVYYGQGRGGLARDRERAARLLRLAAMQGQRDALQALQALGIEPSSPSPAPSTAPQPPGGAGADHNHWPYHCTPYDNNVVPSPTTLFVENVNYLRSASDHLEATIY